MSVHGLPARLRLLPDALVSTWTFVQIAAATTTKPAAATRPEVGAPAADTHGAIDYGAPICPTAMAAPMVPSSYVRAMTAPYRVCARRVPTIVTLGRHMIAPRRWRLAALVGLASCWCCGWADAVRADALDGWYADLGLGWSYGNNLELDSNDASMDLDRGTNQLSGALGRRFGDAWKVELEFAEYANDPELLYSRSAAIELDSDEKDSVKTSGLMLNLVRELPVGSAWRPYVGVGAGLGRVDVHFSELGINGPNFQRPRRDIIDDDDTSLALQVMAGVTIPLTRHLELGADFRYWHMPDVNLHDLSGAAENMDHTLSSAWLHLRYHGANGGYPAPAPRQEPARGWYVTGSAGGAFALDEDIQNTPMVIDAFDLGRALTLGVGYHLHPRWRLELEANYWKNDVEVMEFSKDIGEDSATGSVESYGLLLNVIYQFNPGSSVRPFVGLGGGWLESSYKINSAGFCRNFVCDPVEQRALVVDDKGTSTAVQAMAGVDVAINDRWQFSAAFRQMISGSIAMHQPDGARFDIDGRAVWSVVAGLRYGLGK